MSKMTKEQKYQRSIRRNLKYFLPIIFKRSKIYFVYNFFKIILDSLLPIVNIYFPARIIGELVGAKNITMIVIYILIVILANNLGAILRKYLELKIALINDKLSKYFDELLNAKSLRLDYPSCEDPAIKDLCEKANAGMHYETQGISVTIDTLSSLISKIIAAASVITIVIFSSTPLLIILVSITTIVNTIICILRNRLNFNFYKENTRLNRYFFYFFYDLVDFNFAKDLRLYDASPLVIDSSKANAHIAIKKYKKLFTKDGILNLISIVLTNIFDNILVYIYLIICCYNKVIDIATLTMLVTAYATFSHSLTGIFREIFDFEYIASYQNYFIDFMELATKMQLGTKMPPKDIFSIEFKHVYFKYPRTDNYVIEDFNLTIKQNERLSLVGLNGAGKSTLMKLLCRLYDVDKGEILLNGIDIKEFDYEEYLKLFSIIFQDFKLISFTIKNNIECLDDNHDKLYDAFTRSGIKERIEELPLKENTYINKYFSKDGIVFSGGEMQKLAIARAIYKDGPIVILDEPTSALDPLAEADIYTRFNEIIGKKMAIFISHRLSSCKFADRIVVLDGKRIVEEGKHDDLMKITNGKYQKMFNEQAKYYQERNKNV